MKRILLSILAIGVILLGACAIPTAPLAPAETPTPSAPAPSIEAALEKEEITPSPAEFEIISLDITPLEVIAGERVSITAEVKNTGGSEGTYTLSLTIDGVKAQAKVVKIAPRATETVSFTAAKDEPGTYNVQVNDFSGTFRILKPAEFTISNLLITPHIVEAGQTVTITANVTNAGEVEGSYSVTLQIDGVQVETKEVIVASAITEIISFTFTEDTTGSYNVEVGGLSGLLVVMAPGGALMQLGAAYPELLQELVKLPELREMDEEDNEAIEDIAYLALLSANPEVKEAFQIMIKGGTPDPKDFRYPVPNHNTELQVLYWLAEQNEFKKDDTLALAIAMAHGLWLTMGDDEVKKTVKRDVNDLLNFLRETNEMQKARGYSQLEDYPLEAKVYLSWRGNDLGRGGHIHYGLMSGGPRHPDAVNIHIFYENERRRVNLSEYNWNNVSIDTLIEMREYMDKGAWLHKATETVVRNLEDYFFFYPGYWIFTEPSDAWLTYKGEKTVNHNMNNANLEFEHFLEFGKGIGVCDDEMTLVDAFLKSWGVASGAMVRTYGTEDGLNHTHIFYYEPTSRTWRSYVNQINIGLSPTWNVYLFTPPVLQRDYYKYHQDSQQWFMKMLNLYHKIIGVPGNEVKEMFMKGVPTSDIKQWIFQE